MKFGINKHVFFAINKTFGLVIAWFCGHYALTIVLNGYTWRIGRWS